MVTANVQEMTPPDHDPRRDKVILDYEDKLRELLLLKGLAEQAENVMHSQFMRNFRDKMEEARRSKAAEWAESHYKPKNFAVDQPRVLAIREVLREMTEFADEQKTNFERAWRAKAAYEGQWTLYMGQFRQIEARLMPDLGPAPATAPAKVEDMSQAVPMHVTTIPLGKKKAQKEIRKALEVAGFKYFPETVSGNETWHWTAPGGKDTDPVYERMVDADPSIVLHCWAEDQLEIQVEEHAGEQARVEDVKVEPRLCVILTSALDDELDKDLTGVLMGLGFNYSKDTDEGEEEWLADFSPEMATYMNQLEDERIIERMVR